MREDVQAGPCCLERSLPYTGGFFLTKVGCSLFVLQISDFCLVAIFFMFIFGLGENPGFIRWTFLNLLYLPYIKYFLSCLPTFLHYLIWVAIPTQWLLHICLRCSLTKNIDTNIQPKCHNKAWKLEVRVHSIFHKAARPPGEMGK